MRIFARLFTVVGKCCMKRATRSKLLLENPVCATDNCFVPPSKHIHTYAHMCRKMCNVPLILVIIIIYIGDFSGSASHACTCLHCCCCCRCCWFCLDCCYKATNWPQRVKHSTYWQDSQQCFCNGTVTSFKKNWFTLKFFVLLVVGYCGFPPCCMHLLH